jgi:peptidoglycan/LPS O-acetylase OafA/YrhL
MEIIRGAPMMAGAEERTRETHSTRLASLDALRGVAALAVVLFHVCIPLGVIAAPNGYLAVDFFFLLSGYVLAHAYAGRLRRGRAAAWFIRVRLERLYPLAVAGVLMGVAGAAIRYAPWLHGTGAVEFAATAVANLLLLPLGRLSYAQDHPLFAFNAPVWSLFWELAVNALYGAIALLLDGALLAALVVLAGLAVVAVSVQHGSLQAGAEAASFAAGAARVGYSFFCGVALQRLVKPHPSKRRHPGPIAAAGLLALLLWSPMLVDSRVFDPATVLFAFPAVLVLAVQGEPAGVTRRLSLFVGDVSYPLYVTHFPIMQLFLYFVGPRKPVGGSLALLIAAELATIAAVAVLVLMLYDRPLRAWLRQRHARSVHPARDLPKRRTTRAPSPSGGIG